MSSVTRYPQPFPTRRQFLAHAAALGALGAVQLGCRQEAPMGRHYAVTIAPAGCILRELTGERAQVEVLLPPGKSPHIYEPLPSDARAAESALALFYVSEDFDGWAAQLSAPEQVAILPMAPQDMLLHFPEAEGADEHDHAHGDYDPHFWGDPLLVQAMLPELQARLTELDPEGADGYAANAERFGAELTALHEELEQTLAPVKGKQAALFHPSLQYLLERYGIPIAGLIEPSPGKEATPRQLQRLIARLERNAVQAIFTEPQLPRRPAEVIAEAAGIPLYELDPLGGVPGRESYVDLLRHNAAVLREALG